MHRGAWRKKIPKTSRQVSSLLPGQKFMSQYVTVKRNGEKFGDVPDSEKTAQEKINMNEEEKSFKESLLGKQQRQNQNGRTKNQLSSASLCCNIQQ